MGSAAARVTYPTDTFSSGGGSQYRQAFELLDPAIPTSAALYVRYYVKFDPDFEFVLGGTLPGFLGGEGNTGGDKPDGTDGFSTRIMWRANGRVVQNVYHPDQPTEYGEDLDWNAGGCDRYFIPGKWHCVETFVQMNSVAGAAGNHDGIVRSWFDGELALDRTDIRFRDTTGLQIDGFYFSTFFGGGDATWAPSKDEHAMFDNFVISDTPIGCGTDCTIPDPPNPSPDPITVASSILVFDSDTAGGWSTGQWTRADSVKDFDDATQNHTPGGAESAYIQFSATEWDAAIFTAPGAIDPSSSTHLRFWVRPSSCAVRFRAQFRGSADSADVVVDGSTTYHSAPFEAGVWQEIIIPIADFQTAADQDQLLIRSDSNTGTDSFWIDDVELVVAQ